MATLFKLFAQSCGLTLAEAAAFLDIPTNTAKSWWSGRRKAPEAVIEKLCDLAIKQDVAAQALILDLETRDIENEQALLVLKTENSDLEAQANGWPCANAHNAVVRKVLEKMPAIQRGRIQVAQ